MLPHSGGFPAEMEAACVYPILLFIVAYFVYWKSG